MQENIPPVNSIHGVVENIRKAAIAESSEDRTIKNEKLLEEHQRWTRLLAILEEQYGIPADVVSKSRKKSRYKYAGFYEGPIRICGVRFVVASEGLSAEGRKTFNRIFRARLTRSLTGQKLTAEQVANLIARKTK
jgi:hypothetical protein